MRAWCDFFWSSYGRNFFWQSRRPQGQRSVFLGRVMVFFFYAQSDGPRARDLFVLVKLSSKPFTLSPRALPTDFVASGFSSRELEYYTCSKSSFNDFLALLTRMDTTAHSLAMDTGTLSYTSSWKLLSGSQTKCDTEGC